MTATITYTRPKMDEPKVEEKKTKLVYDVRFELAALRSYANLHGIPEARFEHLMGVVIDIISYTPRADNPEEARREIASYMDTKIIEFVYQNGSVMEAAVSEIVVIGAAVNSLLRKWWIEANPKACEDPEISVEAISFEDFQKLKDKARKEAEAVGQNFDEDAVPEEPEPVEDGEERISYTPAGNEGWLGKGEDRDVV